MPIKALIERLKVFLHTLRRPLERCEERLRLPHLSLTDQELFPWQRQDLLAEDRTDGPDRRAVLGYRREPLKFWLADELGPMDARPPIQWANQ